MRHVEVRVKRDEHTTHVVTCSVWEIPILEYIFEAGNVERLERVIPLEDDREYPSAEFEFDRLVKAYGKDVEAGEAFAESVYGKARRGVRALKEAMLEEKADEDAGRGQTFKRIKRKRQRAPSAGDPLLA